MPQIIKLMNYTLSWFERPDTLYHSQGSQLDVETVYHDLLSETCRIALLYAHETREGYRARKADGSRQECVTSKTFQFEFQALVLRKRENTEDVATGSCWYERVSDIYHHMSTDSSSRLSTDSIDREEDERFLAWLKSLFERPDYERVEIS